jgi:site-specific DNA recombinase
VVLNGVPSGVRWVIDEFEAAIVREIFELSASGQSLKGITGILNARKTPPPQKRKDRPFVNWCPTAIRAMLRNQLYAGVRIWNKTKFVKVPGSNKRVARPRPRNEWITQDVPELAIVSQELWNRVQARQDKLKETYAASGRRPTTKE